MTEPYTWTISAITSMEKDAHGAEKTTNIQNVFAAVLVDKFLRDSPPMTVAPHLSRAMQRGVRHPRDALRYSFSENGFRAPEISEVPTIQGEFVTFGSLNAETSPRKRIRGPAFHVTLARRKRHADSATIRDQ